MKAYIVLLMQCLQHNNRSTRNSLKNSRRSHIRSSNQLTITIQPAIYQIANYNIHPPPKLVLKDPIAIDQSITVLMVELNSGLELHGNFAHIFPILIEKTLYSLEPADSLKKVATRFNLLGSK